MNNKLISGLIIGAVSGIITAILIYYSKIIDYINIEYYIPGVVFGIFSIIFFNTHLRQYLKVTLSRSLLWIIISTLAYLAAYFSVLFIAIYISGMVYLNGDISSELYMLIIFGAYGLIGGLVGSLFLSLAYRKFFNPQQSVVGLSVLTGTVLGGICFMIMYFMGAASGESFSVGADLVLYVAWQAGMLGVFGYLTSRINLQSVNQQI